MYTPDNWVILKINEESDSHFYKVLAGWSGGYLDGNSWKLNSGITKIEEEGDYYLFHGESGSIYKCHKESETVRMNIAGILQSLLDKHPDKVSQVPFEEVNI